MTSPQARERARAPLPAVVIPLVTLLGITGWTAANAWWLATHRAGRPLNIDEAGYLGIALTYARGWELGGPTGWLDAVLGPSMHAPLTPAVTSLVVLLGWGPERAGMAVVLASGALTLVLLALLAARLRRRAVVGLALVLLATTPGFLAYSRNVSFAVPATALVLAALLALARSRGLTSTPWSLAFGVAVGLLPLTRTMTLAFVPVLLVVAVVQALATPGDRRRQALALLLACLAAAGVAATWLVPSRELVLGYLTSYGYGAQSAAYSLGAASPPLALLGMVAKETFVPHFVLGLAGCAAAAWPALRALRARHSRDDLRRVARHPLAAPALVVAGGCAALMSSRNAGSAFALPLLGPAAVIAAAGWDRLLRGRVGAARPVGLALLVTVCVVLAVPSFHRGSVLAEPRYVSVPGTPALIVTEGENLHPAYVTTGRGVLRDHPAMAVEWARSVDRLTTHVLDGSTARPDVALGFRGYFVNVNTLQLEVLERTGVGVAVVQIDPVTLGEDLPAYEAWLTSGSAAASCHLLTSPGTVNEFAPVPDTGELEAAAARVGFRAVDRVATPDGRTVTVWERAGGGC
ncbi:glycosyltransferase family 39 protein [Cellulomonas aerilata]|uniref:Uncharacterized protein n=1 Tax=Cellulomonas aerilata TaxID=515326 RepID=A0A512DH84_9CELL|nr:glycosyltransferase family 39 protein [Cellulomonas aerilata]GEO35806.1 hypothetical protein CAE01nite_35310 [Cellulomonas aerilata]